jgi:hypothetical protein
MDFRIRENDGSGSFPSFSVYFGVRPWQMDLLCLPSLTLPALI